MLCDRRAGWTCATLVGVQRRDSILSALETFLEGVIRLGGDAELKFGAPLKRAPKGLPAGAAEVFTTISRRILVRWDLDDEVGDTLPDEFEECRFGELDLHPKCFETVTSQWWTFDDPLWAGKTVFAPDGSGDYFGIDPTGRVVFLSHDLDEPHGQPLASNLTDLLERWAPLGCVGPAGAALEPFLTKTRLSCAGPPAKRFLKILGGQSRDWKAAKKAKYKALGRKTRTIEADASEAFSTFIAAVTDRKADKAWAQYHEYALSMIDKCYGRAPSPALRELLAHTPGKEFAEFKPAPPGGATTSWSNAFAQAQADVHLLCGALTNTWPIGSDHLVEVDPQADEVSLRIPLLGFRGVSPSLTVFAQRLAVHKARRNTSKEHDELPAPKTRAVSLLEQAGPLRALFEKYSVFRHLGPMKPRRVPANLDRLDCADALRELWLGYLSGAKLPLDKAKQHAAEFVRHSAEVIESLAKGPDVRNPARFIALAREVCMGEAQWPQEHEDPDGLVNEAYEKQAKRRWDEMLEIADRMIDSGFDLEHAWVYRVRALEALERHEEVLDAADRGLLFCEFDSSDLLGAKVRAFAALGDEEASEAHVWWCSPHYRTVKLKR